MKTIIIVFYDYCFLFFIVYTQQFFNTGQLDFLSRSSFHFPSTSIVRFVKLCEALHLGAYL